jgi:MFS family permease
MSQSTREAVQAGTAGGYWQRTFSALRFPDYRRYLAAQTISLIGTWLQFTGQIWLVVKVLAPDNGFLLGVTSAMQSAPILLTLWGGAIADGRDKRRVLQVTQSLSGLIALTLGLTVWAGVISLPLVWVCAFALGLVNAADGPARQAMVAELVDDEHRASAIALASASYQAMRAVGVGLAPLMVAWWGLASPFFFNAASFVVVLVALARMSTYAARAPLPRRARPKVREGLAALRADPRLLAPVVVLGLLAVFALNFDVTLPLLARDTLHSGLGLVSVLLTFSSVGAVAASLRIAGSRRRTDRTQWQYALGLAVLMCALALTRTSWLAAVLMLPLGGCIAATTATTNTILQDRSAQQMRGRIMAVYGLMMQGSSLFGGLIIGALADPRAWGAPGGLLVGATAIVLGVMAAAVLLRAGPRRKVPDGPGAGDPSP